MDVRPYTAADLDPVVYLWMDSWKSTNPSFGQSVTLDVLRERLPREIAGGWSVHVAEIVGEIVGFVASTEQTVEQLFVARSMQGRRIGKRLLDFAKQRMQDGFTLTAAAENAGALRFYRREGLKQVGSDTHARFGHPIVRLTWEGRPRQL